jgi:hypothetical protein
MLNRSAIREDGHRLAWEHFERMIYERKMVFD